MKITRQQARHFLLAHQNLWPPRSLHGKEGILTYIRRVGAIQFDPLDMVGYNPCLVLQSRIANFRCELLQELLYSDRKLLDGWDKNMSIYGVEDWPYFRRYYEAARQKHGAESGPFHEILPEVRKIIEEKGPVSSADLDFDHKVRWPWGPTRAARAVLESMYFWGELIIHRKVGTRKYYDFAEKYLPADLFAMSDPNVTMEEFYQWNVRRRIGAIGLLWNRPGDAWLGIHWMKSKERNEAIATLSESGDILPVEIEGIKYPFYIRKEEVPLMQEVINGFDAPREAAFIAPLDNFIWERKLIKEIFNFEYVWEVYKPAAERQHGYYVLPILYGDRFIGRFEPRLHKKTRKLEILNWWWEADVVVTEEMRQALARCLKEFTYYLNATEVMLNRESATAENMNWIMGVLEPIW